MASIAPSTTERDTNLDSLKRAAVEWFDKEEKRIDNETKFLRSVLQGRGLEEAASQNLEATADLVIAELNEFIRPGEG